MKNQHIKDYEILEEKNYNKIAIKYYLHIELLQKVSRKKILETPKSSLGLSIRGFYANVKSTPIY